jgi:hypothetical protein
MENSPMTETLTWEKHENTSRCVSGPLLLFIRKDGEKKFIWELQYQAPPMRGIGKITYDLADGEESSFKSAEVEVQKAAQAALIWAEREHFASQEQDEELLH